MTIASLCQSQCPVCFCYFICTVLRKILIHIGEWLQIVTVFWTAGLEYSGYTSIKFMPKLESRPKVWAIENSIVKFNYINHEKPPLLI